MTDCMAALAGREDVRIWRNNVGCAKDGGRFVRFGLPGSADITGITQDGLRLEIEVKAARGKLSCKQERFRAMIEKFGGVYIVARSAEELTDALDELNKKAAGSRIATAARGYSL